MNWPKVMLNWLEEITVIWTRCLLIFDLLKYNQSLVLLHIPEPKKGGCSSKDQYETETDFADRHSGARATLCTSTDCDAARLEDCSNDESPRISVRTV
jgi:hypothetical protein